MTPGGYRDAAGTFKEGNKTGTYVRCKKATTVQAYARPAENTTSTSADLMARVAQWPAGAQVEEAWFTWSTSSLFDPEVAPENVDCVEYTGEILDSTPDLDVVKLILTDLQPNTTYYYRIHSDFTTTE